MQNVQRNHRFVVLLLVALIGVVVVSAPVGSPAARATGVQTAGTSLIGVSCWSAKGCIAVGDFSGGATDATLAGRWNGHAWTHLKTPNASGAALSLLTDVSCTSASHCVAIGTSNSLIAVESWNGTAWKLWQPPVPPPAIVPSISCGSANGCEVVGDRTNEKDDVVSAAEKWDGSQLNLQSSPKVQGGDLLSASCTSASRCVAVGNVTLYRPNELVGTLAERWSAGGWKRLSTPNPGTAGTSKDDQLLSVSCVSASSCMAVGQNDTIKGVHALAEAWNGKKWRVLKTAPGSGFTFYGVSCAKVKSCIAVGGRGSGTLVEKWNGKSWRLLKAPTSTGAFLNAVSCPKVTSCLAVGTRNNHKTLAESWNGKKWRALKTLKP